MKGFRRENLLFSLCGLNCGLCPMQLDGFCPGCGGGDGNQSCSIAACSLRHSNTAYCFQCPDFPCGRYTQADEYDSFVTHQNRLSDLQKAEKGGIEAYNAELREKTAILKILLSEYNDGRKKSFFCLAVNLLTLDDLLSVMQDLETPSGQTGRYGKENAARAAFLLQALAERRGVTLKLRRKPRKKGECLS